MTTYQQMVRRLTEDGITVSRMANHWLARIAARRGASAFTFRQRIYVADELVGTPRGALLLEHEAVHARDQRRWGAVFYVTYVGLVLGPLSLRGLWEWRGFRAEMRAMRATWGQVPVEWAELVVTALAGPLYLWAMPRWLVRRLVERERR